MTSCEGSMTMNRCPGSHAVSELSWPPIEKADYPGAIICPECSLGIAVVRGSVREVLTEDGLPILFGKIRVHRDPDKEVRR